MSLISNIIDNVWILFIAIQPFFIIAHWSNPNFAQNPLNMDLIICLSVDCGVISRNETGPGPARREN